MRTLIVNAALGTAWFWQGQKRLIRGLERIGYTGLMSFYRDSLPDGCPTHKEIPYAFKPYCIEQSIKEYNPDIVLWCDAAVFPIRPLDTLIEAIINHPDGCWYSSGGGYTREWVSDRCLEVMGVRREELGDHGGLLACCMGWDLNNPRAKEVLEEWFAWGHDGRPLVGDWNNNDGQVSLDPNVRGHRHDQSVMNILCFQMGIKLFDYNTYLSYLSFNSIVSDTAVFVTQGMLQDIGFAEAIGEPWMPREISPGHWNVVATKGDAKATIAIDVSREVAYLISGTADRPAGRPAGR